MSDNQDAPQIQISSTSSDYEVQTVLGFGSFGLVSECKKLATNETVALKVFLNKERHEDAHHEVRILTKIKELDSEKFGIVRFNDSFSYNGNYCLEFEKLDISLCDFMEQRESPLQLKEIRPIVQQLATALDFLERVGVIHGDLKPANIMMVDHVRQPLKVKVIDFGLACDDPQAWTGFTIQSRWYRAPEVLLGAPFDEAVDVWSLGCITAEMFIGNILFPGSDDYDMMRHIFHTIGKPADHLLDAGMYTRQFFRARDRGFLNHTLWSFMSALEVRHFNLIPRTITSLDALLMMSTKLSGEDGKADESDLVTFVDLLTKMLKVDPAERITASQILQHPFLTMSHLGEFSDSLHVKSCVELMSISQGVSSDHSQDVAQQETPESPDHHPDGHQPAGMTGKEQPFLQSVENNPAKRKRSAHDDADFCIKSPDTSPHKRSRTELQDAGPAETCLCWSRQTSPQKSPLKRKAEEADPCETSDCIPPTKRKRSSNLNAELADCVRRDLSNTKDARSSSTQDTNLRKRKRADEEAQPQEETSTHKRRSLLEKGVPTRLIRSLHTV